MHKFRTAAALVLASVSGQSLADTVFYDNSDLEFLLIPLESYPRLDGGFYYHFADNALDPLASPTQNANGTSSDMSIRTLLNRDPGTGSSTSSDSFSGPAENFAFAHTGQGVIVGTNGEDRSELVTYQPGDTVQAGDFMPPLWGLSPRSGTVTWYEYGSGGPVPIYGPEVILGFKIDEPGGTRFGYLRLTFMEDMEFEHHDENGSPTGSMSSRDLYVVTGWGYETELDTPVTVITESTNCTADVNNDGVLTPADFSAWVAAFNANAPDCDQNDDGSCTPADFSAWVANYNAGC